MKTRLLCTLMAVFLFITPNVNFGQAPNLGSTSSFAFFTAGGAFSNDGASVITGDIGSYTSSPVGFPPGTVIGNIYTVGNSALESPFFDVATAFSNFTAGGTSLATPLEINNGTGFIYPGTYSTVGAAALNGNFTLDAQGDPNAIFVININGRLDVASLANIFLINSASECNVYWQIDGAFELGAGAHFVGTVIANGAISLLEGSTLLGRGLSTAGAIALHTNVVSIPICITKEELTIEKVADKSSVSVVGEVINYTITVVNTGNVNLTNVVLTDVFAGGATLASGDVTNTGVLDVGETWIYTADYVVTQADIDGGTDLVNSASVDTDQTDVQLDDATTTISQNASLTIVKVADKSSVSSAGETITYTITVVNTGNVNLTNVVLTDVFAGGATLASGDVTNTGVLDVGETWIYTADYVVTQANIDAGTAISNSASVDTDQTNPLEDEVTTTIGQNPSLTIVKVADKSSVSSAGETITYTITVDNTGNVNLTNVVLTDVFAGGATLTSGDVTNTGVLDVGETWIYTADYVVTQADIDAGTALVNSASVDTGQTNPLEDDATTTISQNASLIIEKVADKSSVSVVGDVITYTITVVNTGDVNLTGVVLTDRLSFGPTLTELAVNLESGDLDGDNVLDVGETWVYKTDYTVTQSDIDYFMSIKAPSLLKCAEVEDLINVATVVTDQTQPQSDDASTKVDYVYNAVFSSVNTTPWRKAMPVTINESCTISSISIYHNGGAGHVLLGVYSDQSGLPSSQLGVTPSTVVNSTAGWQTVPLSSPVTVTPGQKVWLAWVFENAIGTRYTETTPGRAFSSGQWSGGMPATFGTATIDNYRYSIYYTCSSEVATPSLTVTPTSILLGYGLGSNGTFNITSNTSWSITDDAGWLDVSLVSGSNNGIITVTANSANTGTSPRSATVTIAGTGVASKTVTVTQEYQSITTTLGNTEIYGSSSLTSNRRAVPVTFSEAGSIQSISIYHHGGSGNVLLGVYSDQSGSPSSLLGVTAPTVKNTTAGWQTVTLTSPVTVTSGQTVWLSWLFQYGTVVRYAAGTPGRASSTGTWSGGMPATFGTATFANYKYSIYCTYSSGTATETKSVKIVTEATILESMAMVKAYPNPFNEKLNIEFGSTIDTHAKLEIFNIAGAKLEILFNSEIKANELYNVEYIPHLVSSQVVIYRLTMDGKTQQGKLIYQNRR